MSEFNFESSVYTNKEQSERLLILGLKKETADIRGVEGIEHTPIYAWSLHRLLLLIPKEVDIDGYRFPLRSDAVIHMNEADDMYEYLISVLERTIKEGYFNKEYLER